MAIGDQDLWNRIRTYSFPASSPVAVLLRSYERGDALARHHAHLCVQDYRRFLFLLASTGEYLLPGPALTTIWRGHADAKAGGYKQFCDEVIGHPLPEPPPGHFSCEAPAYHLAQARYRATFGEEPNRKIWPDKAMITKRRQLAMLAVLSLFFGIWVAASVPEQHLGPLGTTIAVLVGLDIAVVFPALMCMAIGAGPWGVAWPSIDHDGNGGDFSLDFGGGSDGGDGDGGGD